MDELELPDLEFDIATKKGSKWHTVGTVRKAKNGKSYTAQINDAHTLEGQFSLFPKKQQKKELSWEEIIDSYPSAADEYGI